MGVALVEVNEKYARIFDYLHGELIGRSALDVGVGTDLKERDYVLSLLRRGESIKDPGRARRREEWRTTDAPLQHATIDSCINNVLHWDRRGNPGELTLVWDRLQAHRAREVQEFLSKFHRITCRYLPPYAPELNPVEYTWSYLKMNPLANVCPTDIEELSEIANQRGHLLSRRRDLLRSFLNHSPLIYCLR